MVPRPPPGRPPKQCADCDQVLPDPRATRCAQHAAERRRELRRTVNANYYGELRVLADAGLAASEAGGAAWITTEAARRLADAGERLADAVTGLDRAVLSAPVEGDPTGERVIRLARTHLRNEAKHAARLVARIMRDLAR